MLNDILKKQNDVIKIHQQEIEETKQNVEGNIKELNDGEDSDNNEVDDIMVLPNDMIIYDIINMIKKDEIKITISDEKDYVKLEIKKINQELEKEIVKKFKKNNPIKIYNKITGEVKETKLVKLFNKDYNEWYDSIVNKISDGNGDINNYDRKGDYQIVKSNNYQIVKSDIEFVYKKIKEIWDMKKQIKNKNELLKNYKKIFDFFENSNIEKSSGFGRPRSKKGHG